MSFVRTVGIAVLVAFASDALAVDSVTHGKELDYQPAVIQSSDDGARIVVFERLDTTTLHGDLWLTRSQDGGTTWSSPVAIVASAANERHPALVQLGPSSYVLFYLKGADAAASFRIWRATSSDGIAFEEEGQVDLGWATGGEINPHVIRKGDGTLTMSYQRLTTGSSQAYVAQSLDGGESWDTLKTLIDSAAALPRIAYREGDGLYLASYQRGSSAVHILIKTTTDVRDWSGDSRAFALDVNNHDSLPFVLPDGTFGLFWIRQAGNGFDVLVRRSEDALVWGPTLQVTASPNEDDVEPHPLVGTSSSSVELYWGRDAPSNGLAYDIVRQSSVALLPLDTIFPSGFDAIAVAAAER